MTHAALVLSAILIVGTAVMLAYGLRQSERVSRAQLRLQAWQLARLAPAAFEAGPRRGM